ncbi:zinc-dependent alcohol dehydrogenase [Oceanobacillus kimchii]|uniref:zinc-dependent alcohol dehydrogenase n=1 Tax=Oceanobacillus kimchii TaxID=746691 RepID=UPI00034680F2|nr:alcohol dehydrogenase catalytic domain-containing protein [Oceanobacillus kimchii]
MDTVIYAGPKNILFQKNQNPTLTKGWAIIKTSYAGICGSDLSIFAGVHPRAEAPLVMGHEFSGTIEEGHPTLKKGTRVTVNPLLRCGECHPCRNGYSHVCENLKLVGIDCDGGMGEYVKVPIHSIVPLKDNISMKLGALIEPVAVAVHAIRQGNYISGDSVVIFGAGTIGLCVALTLRSYGAKKLIIVEPNKLRIEKAKELGFQTIDPLSDSITEKILEETGNVGVDYVFDCAGHPSVVEAITDVVKVRGNIIVVAMYKQPPILDMRQGMFKELIIKFVRVYTDKDFQIAIDLVGDHKEYEEIITHVLQPEEAEKGFELLTRQTDAVKVMYEFNRRQL